MIHKCLARSKLDVKNKTNCFGTVHVGEIQFLMKGATLWLPFFAQNIKKKCKAQVKFIV